jgi:hypothetical protein
MSSGVALVLEVIGGARRMGSYVKFRLIIQGWWFESNHAFPLDMILVN